MKRPRVLLAEDYRLLREMLAKVLEPDCEVVGEVADGRALLKAASRLQPDIVVVDIAMPLLNGLDAARQLQRLMPEVKVIFLTANEDPELAAEAMGSGAAGYILKSSAARELGQAIKQAWKGGRYVTPLAAGALNASAVGMAEAARKPGELSLRRREVLQLLAEGHSMKQIARLLRISTRTVAFHKYSIMEDHGIKTNAELIQFAIKQNLVSV
jgi:DNA-binding NarL/FixJ family response regulator